MFFGQCEPAANGATRVLLLVANEHEAQLLCPPPGGGIYVVKGDALLAEWVKAANEVTLAAV